MPGSTLRRFEVYAWLIEEGKEGWASNTGYAFHFQENEEL
jgi:hypothetical protein